MPRAALYICYYHITDPLVESQVVAYLRAMARNGVEVHLLTFERQRLSAKQQAAIRERLAESGIRWHTLRYHQRPSLPATLFDVLAGTLTAARICQRYGIRFIHARAHVPGAMALLLKRLLGCRFLFDLRGLMAEEYLDAGRWSESDIKFRLTKRMERVFLREADALVMLTERIRQDLILADPELRQRDERVQVIPCCVDVSRFHVSDAEREEYRKQRGWSERKVLLYLGKVGTWYRPEAMVEFFRAFREQEPRGFFQILTQDEPGPIVSALEAAGIAAADYDLRYAPPADLPLILSAADASISFRAGEYSKRAASPTKVGECLAAGLPVVTNAGIGDCDALLGGNRVGVVLDDLAAAEYRRGAQELAALLQDPEVRGRCREVAEGSLSLEHVGAVRYGAIYDRLVPAELPSGPREAKAAL